MTDFAGLPYKDQPFAGTPEVEPDSLRELTEEEVVAAARGFWLDEVCEKRDEDDEPALNWEH